MSRSVPDLLPGAWLPGDGTHPLRPDAPILRHLTFTEAHAVEMGIGLTVFLYVAVAMGVFASAWPVALFVIRTAVGQKRKQGTSTDCNHTIGLHDIRSDPWYFVVAGFVTAGVLLVVFGTP